MQPADAILINADIRTMDSRRPRARAMALRDGRVLAVGDEDAITALAGSGAQVMDGRGRQVLPGFHDTHIHVQDGGQHFAEAADLSSARTLADLQGILREFAATSSHPWVLGNFYDASLFGVQNLDRQALDAAVPDRPCLLISACAHNGCMNSKGCEAVGLSRGTPDPDNGHFVLDGQGNPTGLLHETATMWVHARMPPIPDSSYEQGVLFAQALANRNGFTGLLDASIGERHARVYKRLVERNALTARILATVRIEASETTADAVARASALRAAHQSEMFRIHSAKFFLDGVIENRTAAMIEDYSDAQGGNAPLMFSPNQINDMFVAFDAARFQIHVHAIGDLAVRAALDGMEAARKANAPWPSWHHIAHIQCLDPADAARFAELGAVANIQPLWARHGPSVTQATLPLLGAERSQWVYAFRSLVDAGAMAVLSSDWTVSTLNPFQIMETAMTRQPPRAEGDFPVFLPEQRLTLDECVEGYTINAARAGWREATTGSLAPGKWADFIVIDRDLWATDPRDIGDTEVLATYLAGQAVHGEV